MKKPEMIIFSLLVLFVFLLLFSNYKKHPSQLPQGLSGTTPKDYIIAHKSEDLEILKDEKWGRYYVVSKGKVICSFAKDGFVTVDNFIKGEEISFGVSNSRFKNMTFIHRVDEEDSINLIDFDSDYIPDYKIVRGEERKKYIFLKGEFVETVDEVDSTISIPSTLLNGDKYTFKDGKWVKMEDSSALD